MILLINTKFLWLINKISCFDFILAAPVPVFKFSRWDISQGKSTPELPKFLGSPLATCAIYRCLFPGQRVYVYTYVQISGIQQRWRGATSLKLWISFSPLSVSISLALTDSPLHKERPPSNTTKTTRERATHTWVNKSQP